VIEANNVRDALPKAVEYLWRRGTRQVTREGEAFVAPEPVTIHYKFPKQHVLINPIRDANPFFHLMESMWMLAGRHDGAFLDHYIKGFSERYATHGIVMDAYGQRWRHGYRYDQLTEVLQHLSRDPTSRQAVLQMWGAGRDDLRAESSKPCNLSVVFRIQDKRLNMTVFNRSNDLIWGCCGANAVHFPIMQEYIAGRLDVGLGGYWQVSNNLHMYCEHYAQMAARVAQTGIDVHDHLCDTDTTYEGTEPLIEYPDEFESDLFETLELLEIVQEGQEVYSGDISNPFMREVVIPMAFAHQMFKLKQWDDAFEAMDEVKAEDWQRAGREWLERRRDRIRR